MNSTLHKFIKWDFPLEKKIFYKDLKSFMLILSLMFISMVNAQSVGISTELITPDPSAILELRTSSKGMLIPRMTIVERNAIALPANGLMIYNTSDNQFNFYNGNNWVVLASNNSNSTYFSVDAGAKISTSSTSDVVITDMSKTAAESGPYLALFNGQVEIPSAVYTTGFSTATATSDVSSIYNSITALPVTNTSHPLVFGNGEVLSPGVYNIVGAVSIAGILTLDGGGDSNALFVIRGNAAFNTGAGTTVKLINGASPENVYWIAEAAIGLGASTVIQGTIFSNTAAIAVGATSTITGRLLTNGGAISFGPGTLSLPSKASTIDFKSVKSFIMFTGSGGIANTGSSTFIGDIGTNLGAITGFETATISGTIFQAGSTTVVTPINHIATFSLYKNGVLIPNSSRTRAHLTNPSDISLQGFTSVLQGDVIDVRWKIDAQSSDSSEVSVLNRILTLIKIGN